MSKVNEELASNYREFFNGDMGVRFVKHLTVMSNRKLIAARDAMSDGEKIAFLSQARGVEDVLAEIKRLQKLDKTKGGRT